MTPLEGEDVVEPLEALERRVAELQLKEAERQEGRCDLQKRLEQVRRGPRHHGNEPNMVEHGRKWPKTDGKPWTLRQIDVNSSIFEAQQAIRDLEAEAPEAFPRMAHLMRGRRPAPLWRPCETSSGSARQVKVSTYITYYIYNIY